MEEKEIVITQQQRHELDEHYQRTNVEMSDAERHAMASEAAQVSYDAAYQQGNALRHQRRPDHPQLKMKPIIDAELPSHWQGFGLHREWEQVQRAAIRRFCDAVERQAEANMLKTGKLEGAHYAAMKKLLSEL